MANAENFTTPVGRLVRGSLYKPNTTDAEGKPLVVKSGPNMGQPRLDYFFAFAIQKGAEQHWNQTEWGAKIWYAGAAAFPQAHQSPAFAWKITDGDSQVPNKKGRKPCDNEGYRGHWILSISSGFAPKIYKQTGADTLPFMEPDAIKLGYYVQVNINCAGNGSQSQPGVFLNHNMVCFSAFGTEIVVGPDVASAGFGAAALPAGASATPPAGSFAAMAPGLPGSIPAPLIPGMPMPGAPAPGMVMPMAPPQPVAAPAPVNPTLQPVPGAAYSIEALRAQGWTDDQIVTGGYAMRLAAAPAPAPLPPGFSAPAPAAPAAPAAPVTPPVPVTPNVGFVQMPAPPAAPVGPQLTAAGAALGTYDGFRAQGWSDDAMRAQGYLV